VGPRTGLDAVVKSELVILLTVSRSVRLGFEPLIVTHGHVLAFKGYFCIVCRAAFTLTGGRFCHVKGSESLYHVYVYIYIFFSFCLLLIF
jgi:hypothetical protein